MPKSRVQGDGKLLLFAAECLGNTGSFGSQLRIGIAHSRHHRRHQARKEGAFYAQLFPEAQRPTHDLAQHVAAALIAGYDAVIGHEGGCADVIRNDLLGSLEGMAAEGFVSASRNLSTNDSFLGFRSTGRKIAI